jgi:pescadillo protein
MGYDHIRDNKKRKRSFERVFLTRTQASRKLGVDARTFKKLCILKGVYPRHAKKIPEACRKAGLKKDSTFYFSKDINWIGEDPIVKKLFRFETYQKKMTKFAGRKDFAKGKHYKEFNKPEYSVAHCVKERYPSFIEAVRDLDDALCHVYLYSQLPAHVAGDSNIEGHTHLTTGLSTKSKRLAKQWNEYVAKASALRKAFISVKGFYFQAEIMGQTVTWLVPHHYTTKMPKEVDYHVMITFLEFYTVMVDFVLFRLEHDLKADAATGKPKEEDEDALLPDAHAEDFPVGPEEQAARQHVEQFSMLFRGFKFFIGQEVPYQPLSLMCRALGGIVVDIPDAADITHQVMDRPEVKDPVPNRDYVQPQWVVDCLNCKHVLPVDQYWPGKQLPPHLSPFSEGVVTDHLGRAYEPERLKELQRIIDPTYQALASKLGMAEEISDPDDDSDKSDGEAESIPEAHVPMDGVVTDDEDTEDEDKTGKDAVTKPTKPAATPSSTPAPADRETVIKLAAKRKQMQEMLEKRMRLQMLSNNKKKLWHKLHKDQKRKDQMVAGLDIRRKMIAEGKLRVVEGGVLVNTELEEKKKRAQKLKKSQRKKAAKGQKGAPSAAK